jgi:hypothetical protein
MVLSLSHRIEIGFSPLLSISVNKRFNQIASLTVSLAVINSASVVDRETQGCLRMLGESSDDLTASSIKLNSKLSGSLEIRDYALYCCPVGSIGVFRIVSHLIYGKGDVRPGSDGQIDEATDGFTIWEAFSVGFFFR